MAKKIILIFIICLFLVECKYVGDCALGSHTGEKFYFNVRVVQTNGIPIENALVVELPTLSNIEPTFSLEEFGRGLKDNERIQEKLGITDKDGHAAAFAFHLGCERGPISAFFEINKSTYQFPYPTNIFVYKEGFEPLMQENTELWKFSRNGNVFSSNHVEVQLKAN